MVYHLNIRQPDRTVRDEEGSDLPDVEAAREEAIVAARELLAEAVLRGEDSSDRVFEIVSDDAVVVAQAPFAEAVCRTA